jgi:hypothetical protein
MYKLQLVCMAERLMSLHRASHLVFSAPERPRLDSTAVQHVLHQHTLSCFVLAHCTAEGGPTKVDRLHESALVASTMPKTVGGFFINFLQDDRLISPEEWLVNVYDGVPGLFAGNPHMPQNLYLMCGTAP